MAVSDQLPFDLTIEDSFRPWQRSLRRPEEPRPAPEHALSTDTERAAAIAIMPKAGTGRGKVLEAIAANEPYGLTDFEIHIRTGLLLYTAAPRRNELRDDGWIVDSGHRRKLPTGVKAVVWILSRAGRERLDS